MTSPRIAVSTVIFSLQRHPRTGALGVWIPLVRRIRNPYLGLWALPGGPLDLDEGLETAARRTLSATTELAPSYLEQLYAFGELDRTSSTDSSDAASIERFVSIVYWALVSTSEAQRAAESENVRWFAADDVPGLAFDHRIIVDYALSRLRNKLSYGRIAHAFVGERFTLAQLRSVYEVVLGTTLDPANFRRQIESSGDVVATDEMVTGTRHRPARLYRAATVATVETGPHPGQHPGWNAGAADILSSPSTTSPPTPDTAENGPLS
ncbi:MAG: hypothetical protein RI885_1086 [Actinomycetota bacterium]